MTMKQPSPISVRPRKGSKLEEIWEDANRSNRTMGEEIHSWAEQFSRLTKENGEERDEQV